MKSLYISKYSKGILQMLTQDDLESVYLKDIYIMYDNLAKYPLTKQGVMQNCLDAFNNQVKYKKGKGLYIYYKEKWNLLDTFSLNWDCENILYLFLDSVRYICDCKNILPITRQYELDQIYYQVLNEPKTEERNQKLRMIRLERKELDIIRLPAENIRNVYTLKISTLHRMLVNHCIAYGWLYTD